MNHKRSSDPARISDYFAWGEVTRSEKAIELGIDNSLPPELVRNALMLHDGILWPLRHDLNRALHATSWYRCYLLNRALPGAAMSSYHLHAIAGDLHVFGISSLELSRHIVDMKMPYDMVINEFGNWCHVQRAKPGNRPRLAARTAYLDENGDTKYLKGLHEVDAFTRMLA